MSASGEHNDKRAGYQLANSSDVEYCAALAKRAGRLGIDTEFMSEGHFRAQLCLTQVAVEDPDAPSGLTTILIDGLDGDVEVEPLASVLADPAVQIVFHAGRQDVAILRRSWKTTITNIFDTQVAAGFAGEGAQVGYGNLLASVLRIKAAKTASYTRWDVRPLTNEQLDYAAEDVLHLLALCDELRARLDAAGRYQWALEECERLEAVSDERDPDQAWERLPKIGHFDARTRAIARRLAAWREHVAAAEDRPVSQVVQDATLIELARRRPDTANQLGQIRGLHGGTIKRRGKDMLAAIAAGLEDPPIPHDPRRSTFDPADIPLVPLCEALVRTRAKAAGVAYELVATRAELEQVIAASRRGETGADVRTLRGWRRELVGAELGDLLAGRAALQVGDDRQLRLIPVETP